MPLDPWLCVPCFRKVCPLEYISLQSHKRKLRELFTKKERGIEWESGQELVSADTFSVIKQKEDLLRIHLSGSGQKARNLYQAQQEASSMAGILEGGTDSLYHRYVYW